MLTSIDAGVDAGVDVATRTVLAVCPKAPPGAKAPVDDITGYVLWAVLILFGLALVVGVGAIVGGRLFSMPHASKIGVVGLVVVFCCAVAYLVLPGILDGLLGRGCVDVGLTAPAR